MQSFRGFSSVGLERLLDRQEVTGSNPVILTKWQPFPVAVFIILLQNRRNKKKVAGRKLIVVSGTRININSQTEVYGNNHTQIAVILSANEDLTIKAKIRIFCIVFVVIFQEP